MRIRNLRAPAKGLTALLLVGTLGACVTNEELGNPDGWQAVLPAEEPQLAALVPQDIADKGSINVATNPPYASNEFKDSQGNIIGFEMDLIKAAGSLLGLKVNVIQRDFNLILPSISAGTVDVGASAFTDTEERQKHYDFVDFFNAGVAWATQPGREHEINIDDACGLSIAVQQGTYSDTDEVNAKSEACVAAGKPAIDKLVYPTADTAATATLLGRADAYSSDSPVMRFAIERADGDLVQIGDPFDTAPFGWAVDKGNKLGPALAEALHHLIESGDYERILTPWGLVDDGVDHSAMNLQPYTPTVRKAGE